MRPFDEFLSQLPADDFDTTIEEALSHCEDQSLTEQINVIGYQSALIMLRKYHEWLISDQAFDRCN